MIAYIIVFVSAYVAGGFVCCGVVAAAIFLSHWIRKG